MNTFETLEELKSKLEETKWTVKSQYGTEKVHAIVDMYNGPYAALKNRFGPGYLLVPVYKDGTVNSFLYSIKGLSKESVKEDFKCCFDVVKNVYLEDGNAVL